MSSRNSVHGRVAHAVRVLSSRLPSRSARPCSSMRAAQGAVRARRYGGERPCGMREAAAVGEVAAACASRRKAAEGTYMQ